MAATLMMVAAMARRMMNLEKDRSRLKAILRAMKNGMFRWTGLREPLPGPPAR
jgi:hypothetical protein